MTGLPVIQVELQVNDRYKRYILFSLERTSRRDDSQEFCRFGRSATTAVGHWGPFSAILGL